MISVKITGMKFRVILLLIWAGWGLAASGRAQAAPLADLETAIMEQDYQKAQQLASDYLSHASDPAEINEARYYLGLSQLYQTQFTEAKASFQQILNGNPDERMRDKAALGVIDAFYMNGEYEDALREAQGLIQKSPNSALMSLIDLKIARANLRLTNWAEARQYLEKIIAEFPESFESHIARQLLEEQQYFAVQVGSFLDRQRAESLMAELQKGGEYTYIVETADRDGNIFYRVRVGQLSNLNEAEELKKKLSKVGYPTRIYP